MPQQYTKFPTSLLHSVYNKQLFASLSPKIAIRCLLATCIVATLTACSSDEINDLRQYVKDVKAQQKGSIPPLPKPEDFETVAYDDTLLRNPFLPTSTNKVSESRNGESQSLVQPDRHREKDILEQYALGSLKMVGSLEKDGKLWALIKTSDGTVHRTTAGRHIGQDNGKIIQITENQIDLREIVPDGLGGWIERRSTLTVSE
jgi:type IV pilus assembly protein PilP